MKINITLVGCDDSTSRDFEVTENEYEFLLKIKSQINEISTYGCMPTLSVEKTAQEIKA